MQKVPPPVAVVGMAALLPDGGHRVSAQQADAADHGAIVAADPVTADLKEAIQYVPHVVECVGPLVVGRRVERFPRLRILRRHCLKTRDRPPAQTDPFRFHQQIKQLAQPFPQFFPVHDAVQQSLSQVVFGGMRVRGQLLAGGFNNRAYGRQTHH